MTTSQDVLNAAQRHAVEMPGGALLILAGPGSGKTRVIAHRIAHLVEARAVAPWRILAVTFTNKAAAEMRERVELLLGEQARELSMGTFHSVCARILRRDGQPVGLAREFAIYDTADQLALVRGIASELALDPRHFAPRALLSAISAAKNERRAPAAVLARAGSYFEEIVGRTFERYEAALARSGAVDFDDLLGRTLDLFEQSPETLARYAGRYLRVLIDEFQDTNLVQYELARAFASVHGNITAVGDPDQSIYSWRAADVRNLQHFERDFPGAQVVLLEQNYRSTGHILRAAHAVIARAEGRPQRELWTENPEGAPVVVQELYDGEEEALFIAAEVRRLMREDDRRSADIAVMYRTNAQSRAVEEACVEHGIRYRIVGGTRFYERHEVRDLLAYLRLVHNAADAIAFARVANVPARGIGQKTLTDVGRAADALGIGSLAVAARVARGDRDPALPQLRGDIRAALAAFVALIDGFAARTTALNVGELLDAVVRETDYRAHLQRSDPESADTRWENVQELRTVAAQYEDLQEEQSLAAFLEEVALVADVDDPAAGVPDAITLTTLHAAKGLEYAVVFMPGMEEGLLPHLRSIDDPAQMEEERRLCYVGMTRARERLYLTHALRRLHNGAYRNAIGSRFLADVPAADRASAAPSARAGSTLSPRERRAALAAREAPATADLPPLAAGDRVRHAVFGPGVVVSCTVRGDDQEVAVAFEGAGVKRLLRSLAPLELDR
ncbi:MAG: AAA family ATPase [Chloroflexi bacterium]|nr:AAA family ATPase [Chloroflexota bacterium]